MLNKLYYISQGSSEQEQLADIESALIAGCKLIQLRFKTNDKKVLLRLAQQVRTLTSQHQAVFIVNDHVDVALEVAADGVHVGLDDTPVEEVRKLLGAGKIIGGTANNLADVKQRINENCDYIGLGPLRFTETKSNLSPTLGYSGYQTIVESLHRENQYPVIYAIGGITQSDIRVLQTIGIHGIAVSGLISKSLNKPELVNDLTELLNN
jgi:thiamine-phosphate pyrophosphorylase